MNDDGSKHDGRLDAYTGKDYSELIEFPVELVDRDGVVRRYSYEESLAVYFRRIQSAPWRYSDDDLIRAEIGHCSRRIDQIRRSFNARARSGSPAPTDPRAALGEGFGLLERHYGAQLERRGLRPSAGLPLKLSLLSDEPSHRIYHVGFGGEGRGHLLYLYLFDRRGDGDSREAYRRAAASFRHSSGAPDVERLLLADTTEDAGYLLTGTEELPDALIAASEPWRKAETATDSPLGWLAEGGEVGVLGGGPDGAEDEPSSPFDEGLQALRDERADRALESFLEAVRRNPYHREAYLALLAVLDSTGRYDEAELYGEMAARCLPGDGLVRYRQGINLVRLGRVDEAVAAFDEASILAPDLYPPAYFAAHVKVARGRDLVGAAVRLRRAAELAPDEEHVLQSLEAVETGLSVRRRMRVGGALLGALGAAALASGSLAAWLALPLGAVLLGAAAPLGAAVARRRVQRELGGEALFEGRVDSA